ncbi:ankyrin [Periconia macrospinosa]|uniref:Ankyrin n=1 Tax=Periconia macrospinosa TaxID=97972 RepID=A0A2V1DGT0_9PLEO|nr:ankyrin [Periconia macrospinosa]
MSSLASDDVVLIDRDDVSNYNPEQILPESPEEIKAIRNWLEPTEYWLDSGEYRKHLASHVNGTGAWLTSSETYNQWLKSKDHGLLWIKGIPGSGKSVVAAHLIDELTRANSGAPVLYFFFRQIIDANHGPAALLRDWLDQILQYSPPLQKRLKELRKDRRTIGSMSMEDLWKLLHLAFGGLPGQVVCVADALDEMDQGNDSFLRSLADLGQWRPTRVKVIITSRPVLSVEAPLRHATGFQMRLVEDQVDLDISSYVEHGLASTAISADDQALIKKAIPGRANGLFLYAKLAMDAFLKPGARALDVIDSLPADLHELYTGLLREHARRSGVPDDVQLLILQWVTHATRPLRLIELAEIVHSTHPLDEQHDFKASKDLVRAAAGPLLEILPDETVSVIHHSFTEYLKCETRAKGTARRGEYPVLHVGSTHNSLALVCLKYLLESGCLDGVEIPKLQRSRDPFPIRLPHRYGFSDPNKGPNAIRQRNLKYPFLPYAAGNWYVHAQRSAVAGFPQGDLNALVNAMTENHQYMQAWLKLGWPDKEYYANNFAPLHIAAKLGLDSYVEALISQNPVVDAVDADGKTPLWWAAASGHGGIVTTLVLAGANPDVADNIDGLKPLHKAAQKNHDDVIRALLEAGVDPLTPKTKNPPGRTCGNAPTSTGHTPLMYACHYGHLKAVEAFLPFLTKIETAHRALSWSAERGQTELVKRIIQHPGVDINAIVRGETALFTACRIADRNTIKVLIEAGADAAVICHPEGNEFDGHMGWRLNKMGNDKTKGDTALQAFCAAQSRQKYSEKSLSPEEVQEVYSLLIQGGANIHQRTSDGNTLLHSANDIPVLVRLLLRDGADANAVNSNGFSPLHVTASIESVALLIEEGNANIDQIRTESGETPLLYSFWSHDIRRSEAIMKLLEYNPNVNISNKNGDGPLHLALKNGVTDLSIIQALLDSNVDVHGRNHAGETPLQVLPHRRQSFEATNLIVDAGGNVNDRDNSGTTLIWRVMNSPSWYDGAQACASFLKEKGADFEVRDRAGRTLLHLVTASSELSTATDRLQFLIDQGLDVHKSDYCGNTLLHELAKRICDPRDAQGYINLGNKILALGLRLDQPNYEGKTALHILAKLDQPHLSAGLDWMLSSMQTVDQRDYQGNTALHIAVANSDIGTRHLLQAGADSTLPNHEGRVPLHIAAISRKCNALGLLLENIHRHHNKVPVNKVVDVQDGESNTPLYYAVRSGRLESVKMLADAGADMTSPKLFVACASFEHESRPTVSGGAINSAGFDSVSLRLEEIVNILMENVPTAHNILKNGFGQEFCIENSAKSGHGYTYSVFLRARDQSSLKFENSREMHDEPADMGRKADDTDDERDRIRRRFTRRPLCTDAERNFLEHEARHKQHAQSRALEEYTGYVKDDPNGELVWHLLKTRQYDAFATLFAKGVDFISPPHGGYSIIEIFAQHGLTNLLDQIVTLEASRRDLSDSNGLGLFEESSAEEGRNQHQNSRYILFRAIDREIPNMELVRLLIEKYSINVNQVDSSWRTVLHILSEGKHWWHAALAIPYLLSKGANLSLRNGPYEHSHTPLRIALGRHSYGGCGACFWKEAVHALLEGNGVSVDGDALFFALGMNDPDIIKMLLKAGANPNEQSSKTVHPSKLVHPLYTIARKHEQKSSFKRQLVEIFEILLEFGADPFAVYEGERKNNLDHGAMPLTLSKPSSEPKQVTVLHQLLAKGFLVYPILTKDDFDPNHRDQEGCTPLHAACRSRHGINAPIDIAHTSTQSSISSSSSFMDHMLLRGADPLAVDNNGRNILHYMFIGPDEWTFTRPDPSALVQIATKYPSLLNQADKYGKTPFLLAIRNTVLQHDTAAALALLNAGADPHAVDPDLNTALHILSYGVCTPDPATTTAMRSLFTTLLEHGLDINARNSLGQTPVFNAGRQTHNYKSRSYKHRWLITSDVIPFFDSAGADLFVTDKCGRGLLHHQARLDDTEVFRALLSRGLDPALEDAERRTPLDIAAVYDSKYILGLFSKKDKAEAGVSM